MGEGLKIVTILFILHKTLGDWQRSKPLHVSFSETNFLVCILTHISFFIVLSFD